jgi:hypothetical protein
MKRKSAALRGFVVLLIACSGGSGLQDPSPDLPADGVISGSIRDSDGQAIAGAEVLVEPGGVQAISNGQGLFEVEVSVVQDEVAYTIAVAHEDFVTVTGAVILTKSNPTVVFDVQLSLLDEDPTLETLDIAQHTPPGPWRTGPTIDFMIDVRNQGSSAISNLIIVDTLDAEFEHEISLDDITVNEVQFPSAIVTLGSNGRSFQIELGTLEPTADVIGAFTLRTPTPQADGVFCNRVRADGETGEGPQSDVEINCLVS